MGRLRELLAHGGIAILAMVFALASATVLLGDAVAQTATSVLIQSLADDSGRSPLDFKIADTRIDLTFVLEEAIVVVVVLVALFTAWRLTSSARATCSECLSEVPAEATVCRYCTSELRSGNP
jgi:hypothetical protein